MNSELTNHSAGSSKLDPRKSTGRLIATFGTARILRHGDGSLDVCGETPTERNAALAWLSTISPQLLGRVRRCSAPAA